MSEVGYSGNRYGRGVKDRKSYVHCRFDDISQQHTL